MQRNMEKKRQLDRNFEFSWPKPVYLEWDFAKEKGLLPDQVVVHDGSVSKVDTSVCDWV